MLGLIDGDILLYQAATAAEVCVDWGDDLWSTAGDLREAKQTYDGLVSELVETLNLGRYLVVISGYRNFRKDLNPEYKGNRKSVRKPTVFKPLKDWAMERDDAAYMEPLEADDWIGIMATSSTEPCLIVTVDKDLRTIPGKHYNQSKRELGIQTVTPQESHRNWLLQTLAGDATDGYKGIPGVGPVKAGKVLDKHGASWETVLQAYHEAGMTTADAIMNARMAKILDHTLWDGAKNQPILWSPK